MAAAKAFLLSVGDEPLDGVLSKCLEHHEPALAGAVVAHVHEAVIQKRCQPVQHVEVVLVVADLLGGLDGPAPGEDAQASEQALLVGSKLAVAPVDGRPQSPLAKREIMRPVAQQLETRLKALKECRRSEQLGPSGRKLERERQPVEPNADLGDRWSIRG